jgi:hypothetical protein
MTILLTEYNSSTAVTDALSREKFHGRNMAKQITVNPYVQHHVDLTEKL